MSSDFSGVRALRAVWVLFQRRKPSLLCLIFVPPWPPCQWFTRLTPTGLRGSFEIWSLDFFIHFFCAALLSPREIPLHPPACKHSLQPGTLLLLSVEVACLEAIPPTVMEIEPQSPASHLCCFSQALSPNAYKILGAYIGFIVYDLKHLWIIPSTRKPYKGIQHWQLVEMNTLNGAGKGSVKSLSWFYPTPIWPYLTNYIYNNPIST